MTVSGLTACYGSKEILHDIDITLRPHECLALVGESGSGKTTLARCIAGLHPFKIQGDDRASGQASGAPGAQPPARASAAASSTYSRTRTAR